MTEGVRACETSQFIILSCSEKPEKDAQKFKKHRRTSTKRFKLYTKKFKMSELSKIDRKN